MQVPADISSYKEIRQALQDYLEANKSRFLIVSQHPESILNQELDLLAASLTLNAYKYEKNRAETYLYSAKMSSSIYARAKELSYNIHRKSCPILQYIVQSDKTYYKGDILGSVSVNGETLQLIHFDNDKYYSAGDTIKVYVGNLLEYTLKVSDVDYTKQVLFRVQPSNSNYHIDNQNYSLYKNNELMQVTKIMEDYTVKELAADMTTKDGGCEIWVGEHNIQTKYGITTQPNDILKFQYIETTGRSIELYNMALSGIQTTDTNLTNSELLFEGYDEETLSKIVRQAPLMYSTAKRAVTLSDHRHIINDFPLIRDCYAEVDTSKCCTILVHYIKEGSKDVPLVLTDYEVQLFNDYFDNYSIGGAIELYPAICRKVELTFILYLETGVRPTNDNTGDFELKVHRAVTEICNSRNLQLGIELTIGEILADIYKLFPFNDGYVIDTDTQVEVKPSQIITTLPNEYLYIVPNVQIASSNSRIKR